MSYFPQFAALAGVMLLACVSPGPDFVAVSSAALVDRRTGVLTALGVSLGCVLWAVLAVFGLGVVLTKLGWLYSTVRLMGAAYLIWLGGKMLLSARREAPPLAVARATHDHRDAFRRGLLVNVANPKAAAFFGSLFVTVLPVGAPGWVHVTTVLVVAVVAGTWFTLLALIFSAGPVRSVYTRVRRGADAVMGAVLMGLGAKLAIER